MDRGRRLLLAGAGAALMAPAAFAQGREPLAGGGSVLIPSPYRVKTSYPNYSERSPDCVIAYRNWRSTMSGHPECDGMLGVGRAEKFKDLDWFARTCRAALSIQWSDADRIPGQPWDGNEKRWQFEHGEGPDGPELTCQLAVTRVGFFKVYDEPARLFAVADRRGVNVAVWLYDRHGGIKGARRLAGKIAASYEG